MQVSAFLKEIDVCLVAHKELVAPVADPYGRRIDLITVSQMNTADVSANEYRHGVRGTIRQSCIHHPLLMSVLQAPRNICPPGNTICTAQKGGVYGKKRIFHPNIVSACQIIGRRDIQFVLFPQFHRRRIQVSHRNTGIPVAMVIIDACIQVKARAVDVRLDKQRDSRG